MRYTKQSHQAKGVLTPYQPIEVLDLAPAPLWKRLGAMLYDGLVLIALLMAVTACWLPFNQGHAIVSGHILYIPMLISFFITILLFFCFFWWRDGQTLGMRAWRLRVQSQTGDNLSFKNAMLRCIYALISFCACGLGYFWMLIDRSHLTWHDKLTNSKVVVLKKKNH